MKQLSSHVFVSFFLFAFSAPLWAQITDYEVVKVYDKAPHSAFTDLIRFQDSFYCAFRVGTGHVPGKKTGEGDGEIRIVSSKDGKTWGSVAHLIKDTIDLRDAKLSVTPDGRIMVLMGGSTYIDGRLTARLPQVSFSDKDGRNFSDPQPIVVDPKLKHPMDWLWRVTWKDDTGYGVIYVDRGNEPWLLALVKTKDGIHYDTVKVFDRPNKPNEATVRFLKNGDMRIFLRCEAGNAELGAAAAPYADWTWTDLGMRVGGPEIIVLPNEKLLFGHRIYNPVATALSVQDKDGKLRVILKLPSSGDTSYPGFVIHDGKLCMSYYSGHEGKTSIYFTTIPLDAILTESEK